MAHAQQVDDMIADMVRAEPGRERSQRFVALSIHEREAGRTREAIEFAILGSSEAERYGLDAELGRALIELSKAHRSKGDLDNAIGASLRATLVNGTLHSGIRTEALLQLAELYVKAGHPQKALEHLEDARSSTAGDHMDRSRYLRTEASAKVLVLPPQRMAEYCSAQMEEVVRANDKALLLDLTSYAAQAQARMGKHLAALASEEQVLKLAIALDLPFEAGVSANNLGELNHRLGRKEEALMAYNKGLIMVEDLPLVRLHMQVNAAHAHAKSNQFETASKLLDDAERAARKANMKSLLPRLYRAKATVSSLQGDFGLAQVAALDALAMAEELRNDPEQAEACEILAMIFERLDLENESRTYQKKARELEQKIQNNNVLAKNDREAQLLRLQRVEREQMDILNREQRKEARMRQLSLDAENRDKQMALLVYEKQLEEAGRREAMLALGQADRELELAKAAVEAERQERMIQELDNGRMLQSLSLSKLEFQQKEQDRAMELLEKRNELVEVQNRRIAAEQEHDNTIKKYSILLAIGAGTVAIWMAWAWTVARKKKRTIWRQNQQIQGINLELEEKSRNIQSSLGYAQTIQSAILPNEHDLKALMPDSFLMYKPLDIVSGDLPFARRVGDKVFLAAIDCTGHGVPAAMMTFIAYYGLSELLAGPDHGSSGEILDKLHLHVKKTMETRGESSLYNDGFDIGLCVIDLQTGELSFAGAQLPLLLVRGAEVLRFKGDVLPLGDGHFERDKGYQEHKIQLQKGDSLFLFSDGIIHQFGGDNGRKKFSMKKLTELLIATAGMDLQAVKAQAEHQFAEWKGEHPQTDDVLMIGLRYAA